uniref:Uncharacterized protein n=1 Tax=Acrobeloides nanus TaxID=290746 RepID=A0A914CWL6_9BILA
MRVPWNYNGAPASGFDSRWKWHKSAGFILEDPSDHEKETMKINHWLATSYFWSSKEIMIDLVAEDFEQ